MKKLLLLSALAIGAANADIVPNLLVGPGTVSCDFDVALGQVCTYNYTATLHSQTMVTGAQDEAEYFTIYDFNGYIPGTVASADPDWTAESNNSGLTPDLIAIGARDDVGIANLTFTYIGASDIKDGRTFIGFSAQSIYGPATTTDWYSSQAHKQGDTPGGIVQNVGQVQVPLNPLGEPGDVPEPMSMMLFGGGLAAMGLLPRRLKKN